MSNSFGSRIRLSIFGQSHSKAVGMSLEGLPAGFEIDMEELRRFMARRAPGQDALGTARREADEPEFIAGLLNGRTCGAPLAAVIRNTDVRSRDYEAFADIPRPGHADYTAAVKYGRAADIRGGGKFSGRLTAPLCAAGGICIQLLKSRGIEIEARLVSVGGVCESEEAMLTAIADAKSRGDSLGAVAQCVVLGLPAGIGEPMFEGIENHIAALVFAIPAVKGIEFGRGFALAAMRGSEANDCYCIENGRVKTLSNNCGGILGGISNGMPIVFKAAFKPTPSISLKQQSISLSTMEQQELIIGGRHDACVALRALPCLEAAAALAICDLMEL